MAVWLILSAAGLSGVAPLVAFFRRYRRSVAREFQPFGGYLAGTLRLSVGRLVSTALARQFGVRRFAELKLESFDTHLFVPSVDNARIEIDTAYVRLSLSRRTDLRVSDEDLLAGKTGSALLFGEPGSGKSSLTKKLFRQSCRQLYSVPATSRLPVHLELRTLDWHASGADGAEPGAWLRSELIRTASAVRGMHDPRFAIDAWSRRNGLFVLLDGLDEVPGNRLGFAVEAIRGLITSLRGETPHTKVIVTARTQLRGALPRGFLSGMNAVYELQPFSPADIFEFLRKWPYPRDRHEEAQRIFTTLLGHGTLAEMCGNPLVLSMYVAQDQRYANSENLQTVRLPDTRSDFYRSVVGELLQHRRAQQLGLGQGSSELRRREELLGRIALDHLYRRDDPPNAISWRDAVATTRELGRHGSDDEAEEYLRALSLDTGVFTEERTGESLRFIHLSLCEYLAAKEISESGEPAFAELVATMLRPGEKQDTGRLAEVVVFTSTLLKRSERLPALAELSAQGAPPVLVIRAARECQAYGSASFSQSVDELQAVLAATEPEHWDAAWFGAVRLLVACFDELAQLDGWHRTDALLKRLTNDDPERFERLFGLWLRFSPADAFKVAELFERVGDRFDQIERLLDAMDQKELLTYAVARVTDAAEDLSSWALLLAEAALRDELVAVTLHGIDSARLSGARRGIVPWETVGVAANTLLGSVLTSATDQFEGADPNTRHALSRVGVLAGTNPLSTIGPDARWFWAGQVRRARTMALMVLLALVGFVLLFFNGAGVLLLTVGLLGAGTIYATALAHLRPPTKRSRGARRAAAGTQRAMLSLQRPVVRRFPASIQFVAAGARVTTVYCRRRGEPVPDVGALPRPMPLPTVVATSAGLLVDLRGMSTHLQAAYLLGGAFPFVEASETDVAVPVPDRLALLRLIVLLAAPGRWHRHILLRNDLVHQDVEAAAFA
ncbi:NACHT domain-containing protein [Amycolatopsis sp. FBCC-B4732]|uniref:NACHT domain-containing protein n=1 Tax=Amycolatopsis sp. FBCC-B4732 TaxID=3079339 RepID=UPI001FF3FD2A|nr:NACHT domain-containing protein [Amycolatopsis sp. FBCC-B4732]UOX92557.1 NACHT domain-containing protein [Amycolatopsis sp. FBCC-B4732]